MKYLQKKMAVLSKDIERKHMLSINQIITEITLKNLDLYSGIGCSPILMEMRWNRFYIYNLLDRFPENRRYF